MRILDLFCGAGGCSVGYARAGFDVVGVDHVRQDNYPFEFQPYDALEVLADVGWIRGPLGRFDAIHCSPPCQTWSAYRRKGHGVGDGYGDLIAETRELLWKTGLPWIIENIEGAPLRSPLKLCGSMFDPPLDVQRHRYFETDWPIDDPAWPCRHDLWTPRYPAATNRRANSRKTCEVGVWRIPLETQKQAMGVDWDCTLAELSQMVPPVYTTFIGLQLAAYLARQDASASVPDPDAEVPACPSPSSPAPTSMRVTRASTTAPTPTIRLTLRGASSPASSSASPASSS